MAPPHGLVVVGIHYNHNPPTIVLITSDADLDGVLLHVGFGQVDCGSRRNRSSLSGAATMAIVLDLVHHWGRPAGTERRSEGRA